MISTWIAGIAAFVAVISLITSLWPRISALCPKPDLKIQYREQITLDYCMGFTGFHITVRLKNTGNTDLEFESINLSVKDPSGTDKNYIVKFLVIPTPIGKISRAPAILLSELRKGDSWLGTICFADDISPSEEEEINDICSQVTKSVIEKKQSQNEVEYNRGKKISIDPQILDRVLSLDKSKFNLEKGTYEATITVKLEDNKKEFVEHLEFILFENHLDLIKKQVDDYKYGIGIANGEPTDSNKQVHIEVNPKKRFN